MRAASDKCSNHSAQKEDNQAHSAESPRTLQQEVTAHRRLLNSLPDTALLVFDRDHRFSFAGGTALKEAGFESLNVIGRTLQEAFPAEVVQAFEPLYEKALHGHETEFEIEYDGNVYAEQVAPVRNDDGEISEGLVIARKITKFKQAEAQMRKAKEAAEEANETKIRFLGNMSHELRTPLNGIMGMAELMSFTKLDETQRGYLKHIQTCANSLLDGVSTILDFAQIGRGHFELNNSPFNLKESMYDIFHACKTLHETNRLGFHCSGIEDVSFDVLGDEARFKQIMVNLLSNAVKFTPAGTITFSTEIISETDSSIEVKTTISDTGIGIPKEKLAKLFSPFFQVDSSTTRRQGGLGLGLAVTKEIVNRMGGNISAKSTEGIGTELVFKVRFEKAYQDKS